MASAQNGEYVYDATDDEEMAAFLSAAHLASSYATPMTLKAAIDLGVLDIVASAGPGAELSPAEIASRISNVTNPVAAVALDRIMRYLVSSSVLTCSLIEGPGDRFERRYGLGPACKFLATRPDGASLSPMVTMNLDMLRLDAWRGLKYAVLDGETPFKKIHGVTESDYLSTDPRLSKAFNDGMSGTSAFMLRNIVNSYPGFEGVGTLVDVGGGVGASLMTILAKFPHIKGINFDLPHVVSDAPPIRGVQHVGGDMFETIPRGDAIFMKWILHDLDDEHCLRVLKNCFKALQDDGKLIIVDFVIPEAPEEDDLNQLMFYADIYMLTCSGGKERTKGEFASLAKEAGFSGLEVVQCASGIPVVELRK